MANFLTRLMDRLLGDRTEGVVPAPRQESDARSDVGRTMHDASPAAVAERPAAAVDSTTVVARRERMEREQRERHVAMDRARRREATRQDIAATDDLHDVRTLGTMAAIHAASVSDDWSERDRPHQDHSSSSRSDTGGSSSYDGGSSGTDHSSSSSSSSSDYSSSSSSF